MTPKFSHMDLINQYFKKMIDHTRILELENSNLKKSKNIELDKLKKEFSSLKEAFLKSENQVRELTREKEEILQKEKELSEEIKNIFEQSKLDQLCLVDLTLLDTHMDSTNQISYETPNKSTSNLENESQKMKYLKLKKVPRKLVLKSMYESDDIDEYIKFQVPETKINIQVPETKVNIQVPETKVNIQVPETKVKIQVPETKVKIQVPETEVKISNFDYKSDKYALDKDELDKDESIEVMKKLIDNDLWNCIEASVSPDQQHKSSQTKPKPLDDELLLLTNMFGNFLRSHIGGNKK